MRNIKSTLQAHNKMILTNTQRPDRSTNCNCRMKDMCPVGGNCLQPVVYRATLLTDGVAKTYIGSTNNFKTRYSAHKNSFRSPANMHATALSTFVWNKGLNPTPDIRWEIIKVVPPYRPGQRNCELCLAEKLEIGREAANPNSLNKRTEIAAACRHRARHKLARLK